MTTAALLLALIESARGVAEMVQAGKSTVTEDELDAVFAEIQESDNALDAAIARAKAREANG